VLIIQKRGDIIPMNKNDFYDFLKYGLDVAKEKGLKTVSDPTSVINGYIEKLKYQKNKALLERLDYSSEDLSMNNDILQDFSKMTNLKPKAINWFLPSFEHAYGGIFTVLRFAEYFHTKKNIQNRFIICGDEDTSASDIKSKITEAIPSLTSEEMIIFRGSNVKGLPHADISIATYWMTAYPLLKFNDTLSKFYLIQDYEPMFFPAGFIYGLAEATYHFGFHAIINTPGLYEEYTKKYPCPAEYFTPSVDDKIFFPSKRKTVEPSPEKPFTIFFYGRPYPRNGFELGIAALKKIKREKGKLVKIYTAGSAWRQKIYDPEGNIINLGLLPYEKTGDLYRKCDAGLFFMFTEHPSYLAFELMACGCPVVTNVNSATAWFLKDNINCVLTQPTVSSVCEGIKSLMDEPRLCEKLSMNGLISAKQSNWENEMEKIYRFVCQKKNQLN
jgi:glycosyltransferase involved in cell wall biosynthesis